MSQKTALKTVGILVVISIIAIASKIILINAFPDKFGQATISDSKQEVSSDEAKPDELPIKEMTISETSKNNRNVWSWPYDSAVPIYHNTNLEIYQGRTKDETTLEGIIVYLSFDSIELEQAITENSFSIDENEILEEDSSENETRLALPNILINEQDLQDVLEDITNYTKESLESLGAKVIVLDKKYNTDLQKAAFVGSDILTDFATELSEQNFKSERLSNLIAPLNSIKSSSENIEALNQLFPQVGVSRDQRLLLDVERQFIDRIFINLKYGNTESEDITGSLVQYLANESAAIGAQGQTITDESTEKPAYIGYATDDRIRFSGLMEKNISQLIPGLTYSGKSGSEEKIIPSLRLINLNSLEIEIGQKRQSFDLQLLNSQEQQKIFAEAISNACYEFYCTDLR